MEIRSFRYIRSHELSFFYILEMIVQLEKTKTKLFFSCCYFNEGAP